MSRAKIFIKFSIWVLLAISFSFQGFAQIINDPLQGSTIGTKVGGSFTSEGYTPGKGTNHILYDVPSQVANGYVEFEMKGFHPSDFTETGNDHAFLMMYDGRGIGNTPTWDQFRDNYFRWNFHWRQNVSGFKCVVNCAAPTTLRLNSNYAVFIEDINADGIVNIDDRDWYDEPSGSAFTWDASKTKWYKVKVEWNNKTFKVYVDGQNVWSNHKTGLYDYNPVDFKIWLGSGVDKYDSDISGVVYRNFKLFSYGGSQNAAPIITSIPITTGIVGQVYSYDVNATANPAPNYSLTTFPSGMTINSVSGLIQWTPSSVGNFDVTVKAANGVSPDATQSFTINVQSQNTAPSITSTSVTKGFVGQLYSYDINATGNPTPTYSLTTFPSGMTINSVSGLIQWTPSSVGNFDVTVMAANGVSPDATQSFTINIAEASPCPIGMISYWKLDETSGSVYYDNFGTNNATSTNVPLPTAGRVNGGQQFNGTSNNITAPRIDEYDFAANSSFTFEAWINHPLGSFINEEVVIGRKDTASLSIRLGFTSTNVTFSARNKTNESRMVTGTTNLFDGIWHHIVGVKDGTLNQLRIYVDGVLQNTISASYTSGFDSPTATLSIGWRDITGNECYFEGSIDEVAIYNSALDTSIILKNYNNGLLNLGYCDTPIAPTITTTPPNLVEINHVYIYDMDANGNPAPTYSLLASPSGMTIDSISGLMQWMPTTVGEYEVSVKAANGLSPEAIQSFTITVRQPLNAPTDLTAILSPTIVNRAHLLWQDNSSNELGFIVERKTGDSASVEPFSVLDTLAADVTSFEDSTLADTTTYTFRVKTFNAFTESDYSNLAWVTTILSTVAAPSSLTAIVNPADTNNVLLSWIDNSSNELGFIIERKTGDSSSVDPYVVIDSVAADVISYEDTTVADTTTYTYRVQGFNEFAVSDYSNQAEITTPVPVELTSFIASVADKYIQLDWETETELNNAGFSIQRSNDNIKFIDLAFVKGKGTTTTQSLYSYTDKSVLSGKYYYRLKQVDFDGSVTYSKSTEVDLGIPKDYALEQNYPNPYNPSTTIRFALPINARVIIKLYNALGQEVANILNKDLDAGIHETVVNASNLSSGVYFYMLKVQGANSSNFTSTKRMILMK